MRTIWIAAITLAVCSCRVLARARMARGAPNMASKAAQRIAASIRSPNVRQRVPVMAVVAIKIRSLLTVMRDSRSGAIGVTVRGRSQITPVGTALRRGRWLNFLAGLVSAEGGHVFFGSRAVAQVAPRSRAESPQCIRKRTCCDTTDRALACRNRSHASQIRTLSHSNYA